MKRIFTQNSNLFISAAIAGPSIVFGPTKEVVLSAGSLDIQLNGGYSGTERIVNDTLQIPLSEIENRLAKVQSRLKTG